MRQNLWPNALAKLCGAALKYGDRRPPRESDTWVSTFLPLSYHRFLRDNLTNPSQIPQTYEKPRAAPFSGAARGQFSAK